MAARVGRSPPRRKRPNEDTRENQYCLVCKVQFSNTKIFNEHKTSAVHKQKETLFVKAVTDGLQFCYTCEKIFPSKIELDAHALMSRHSPLYRVEGIQELLNLPPAEEPEKKNDVTEYESRRAKDDEERKEIVFKLNKLRDEDQDKSKVAKGRYYCELCKVDCMNAPNMKVHQDSWRHRAELDKKKDEERKLFEEEAEKHFREADENERIKVPSHLAEDSKYFCEVCSVALPSETEYLSHLKGKKHNRQVSQMRRPYKCYVCHQEYNNEKDFSHHLQSRFHMTRAFKKDDSKRKRESSDVWVEKGSSRSKKDTRDSRDRRSYDKKEVRSSESKNDSKEAKSTDSGRKVEIVDTPTKENVGDLREKLQHKNIIVTKPNNPDKAPEGKAVPDPVVDPEKRAKELEMEVKFKKLSREYYNDLSGLKERLTRERENDISVYQQYESTYNKLCKEEDYVRENLRVLEENDPRKEEHIRDMIRIQRDMREVRQELEIREMMIIKRETLFREKFPNSTENKVVINPNPASDDTVVIDYNHGNTRKEAENPPSTGDKPKGDNDKVKSDTDLRLQLERERLLKRLGPELDLVDPTLREKLLSVILDKEAAKEPAMNQSNQKGEDLISKDTGPSEMKMLNEREKQLEKELAALKANDQPKKITKSLVPQYDDMEEKKKEKKPRGRSLSVSSGSSRSSSNSGSDSRSRKKRRRGSPKSRSERSRKKRRRSTSRERRKKSSSRRSTEDKKRKSDRSRSDKKKPVKMTLKSNQKDSKVIKSRNPLAGDSDSGDSTGNEVEEVRSISQPVNTIPVIGGASSSSVSVLLPPVTHTVPAQSVAPMQLITNPRFPVSNIPSVQQHWQQQQLQQANTPAQRREQFSLWKNPAVLAPPNKNSPKEDVWDIAFSGSKAKENPPADTLNLFNSPLETQGGLSLDILNILKSVAPILQNSQQLQPSPFQPPKKPVQQRLPGEPVQRTVFPVQIPKLEPPDRIAITGQKHEPDNQIQGSSAGGRVRSILKKMKEPPQPVVTEEENKVEVPEIKKQTIPGLEPAQSVTSSDQSGQQPVNNPQPQAATSLPFGARDDAWGVKGNLSYANDPYARTTDAVSRQSVAPELPMFGNDAFNKVPTDGRDNIGSPWTVNKEMDRRMPDDDMSLSSVGSYSRQSYDTLRVDRRELPPDNRPRERSPVGMRRLERDDPYRPRDFIDRERLRDPVVPSSSNPRDLRPLPEDRRLDPPGRLPMERDPYMRHDDRLRESYLDRDPRLDKDPYKHVPPISADRRQVDINPPVMEKFDGRPPVKRPGETDDEFYERFERYYELKRRRDDDLRNRDLGRGLPPRRPDDDFRQLRPQPVQPIEDYRLRPGANSDERLLDDRYRRPEVGRIPPDDFARGRGYPEPGRDIRRVDDERYRRPEGDRRVVNDDHRRVELSHDRKDEHLSPFVRDERPFKDDHIQRRVEDGATGNERPKESAEKRPEANGTSRVDRGIGRLNEPPPRLDAYRSGQPPVDRRPSSYQDRYEYY